jgi:two-component system, OmpR family, alkaline phosphatase synthesis response regulator PhoP
MIQFESGSTEAKKTRPGLSGSELFRLPGRPVPPAVTTWAAVFQPSNLLRRVNAVLMPMQQFLDRLSSKMKDQTAADSDSSRKEILIIESDSYIAGFLKEELEKYYYRVQIALDGQRGLAEAQTAPPSLIILELMLSGLDGWQVCRSLKTHPNTKAVPLLILTVLGQEESRLRGLELGADDYMTKPFSLKEVVSRVRALLRRSQMSVKSQSKTFLKFDPVTIDLERHEVRKSGRLIALTPIEFSLLEYLAEHSGKVFTRDQLITALWKEDRFIEEHNLDVHIHALRQKVEPDPDRPRILLTVHGVGYKLEAKEKEE